MQSRDPLVIACASHDAVLKRKGEEAHEVRRRIDIIRVAVDVEGVVACGCTYNAGRGRVWRG